MENRRLRTRSAVELLALGILTGVFLLVFPERTTRVDMGLALFALLLLALNARFTRKVVWAQFPPRGSRAERARKCMACSMALTFGAVLVFFAAGLAIGYSRGGWNAAWDRVFNWHIFVAVCLYFPWAFVQQLLFQFYLLGRLRTVLPAPLAVGITGVSYALVHLPDLWDVLATAAAGIVWTSLYYRYRLLGPLAFSHAALGSAYYYWIHGRDVATAWTRLLG